MTQCSSSSHVRRLGAIGDGQVRLNGSAHADKQHQVAASRHVLRAGSLGR